MGEFVTLSTDDQGVATIRLDRPPVNALSLQVFAEIAAVAEQCTDDDAIRAVVIWGGPKVFAAGADIKDMAETSFQEYFAHGGQLQEALKTLARLPKVTIAAVNGYALGGGCELSMAADFRYAAEDASFGQPEILLGTMPGAGGTQRLPRLVGVQKAKEMVYGGGIYSARDCLKFGLVDKIFGSDEIYDRAVEAARGYAKGPYALRMAKKAIDEGADLDLDNGLRLETTLFTATFATEDRKAGMRSFIEQGPGKATFEQR